MKGKVLSLGEPNASVVVDPKKNTVFVCIILTILALGCTSQKKTVAYSSDTLKIVALSKNSFRHISYLSTNDFGKVACNGYIYLKNGQAIVVDTPTDDATANELIRWISEEKKHTLKAVVINHFHNDCLGGLGAFHSEGVPSYANKATITLAKKEDVPIPQNGFDTQLALNIGGAIVLNRYFGEAHTTDNIVTYVASEELLFGGCMVKSLNAKKGYLGDANTNEWSATIAKIKTAYPGLKIVIPGHGNPGGMELLNYTETLFEIAAP